MSDTEKNLNKLLVITEKETQRIVQQFLRNSSTFSDECLEEYDLNKISSVKELSGYGFISSKITKHDTFFSEKCIKLANTQVIVWKNSHTKELIIIFVENDTCNTITDKPAYTVHINLIKNAIKELKPVKYSRVTNRCHISRRNITRPSAKNILKRNGKRQSPYDKSSNKKLEKKWEKPQFLQRAKNLQLFLKNTIDRDTNFTSKYVTAIFTPENATKSEEVSKIFLTRPIRYKNDLYNFVNAMEEICPSMKCDKYEYIRKKIHKNNIPVDNIKAIAFIRQKYVEIFLRKNITILKKFSNNLLNKSSIKISGAHFINVKNLNMKVETIKLFTPKCHKKCVNSEENIVSNTEIEEIHDDKHEPEKCIQNTSQDQTIALSSKVSTNKQPKIIRIHAAEKMTKDINENIKEIQTVTSNKQKVKSPRKEETHLLGKNLLKQAPKPVVNKVQVDNKQVVVNKNIVLSQIQESLKIVTKRLAKNTQIIKEIASKSSQFMLRGSQIPLHTREVLKNSSSKKNKVTETNRETKKPNETSQISLKSTMEQTLKHDRKLVTITPIKNYIVDNKRKVGDNSIRSGGNAQKVKISSKNTTSITPVINSQYIVSNISARKNTEPPKLNNIIPVIPKRRKTSLIGKVMRPVPKEMPESQNLTSLTIDDLIPFRSDYPRKDHLNSFSKPNRRTETFLNKLCSSNCLEPFIKCSDKDCKSCEILAETTEPATKGEKKTNVPHKNAQFDFQPYINEPSTSYSSNYSLYPITDIQISPKIKPNQTGPMKSPNCNSASTKSTPISTIYQAKSKQLSGDISKHSVDNKIAKKIQNFGPSNKIQKAIEQSISKNNGQQKIVKQITKSVEQSRTASGKRSINNREEIRSKKNARNLTPKIFTPRRSNTSIRSVQNKGNPICNKRKVNITKNVQKELLFDQKYKMHKNVCDPLKASENMLLETLSKTDENSQPDIQKYLVIIEQKFLKTFSLPEEQKVDAYNTLAQEINSMLSILSTENAIDKQLKIIESLERLTNMNTGASPHMSQSCEKVSYSKNKFKFSTHSLIDLAPKLMMIEETVSSEEIKKKVADDAQPTVCTESISFMKSLSAIMSKQTQLFPSISRSKNDNLKKPTSILKISSSVRVNNSKKVTFGAHDSKHLKSDVSVTFSSTSSDDDDEDYSTIYEEDVVNFTSEEDVTLNSPECSSLIYFKTDISYAFVENLTEISYVILVFHQILIIDQNSLHNVDYETESDTPFIQTSEFEVRVNDFDVKYSKSNFTFSSSIASTVNLNYTFSDISNSNIDIDNVDYIPIEAKSSPNVIEFLEIMANLSFEPVPYREEMFYQTIISYIHATYETAIYYSINIFHQIEIYFTNNLQALVPKLGEQSKQLSELTANINFNLHPRLVSVKPLKLNSPYLEIAYRLQKEKYDTLMNLRKTRSLNMMLPIQNIHNQTLVLNMHVQNYQQSQIDNASINSKCLEDKKDLRKAKDNCNVICNENEKIRRSYKSILIFLYIAIFCTILFCTFLINYKCE